MLVIGAHLLELEVRFLRIQILTVFEDLNFELDF